jgi:ADP-ribose pyrophosphatase YjhB (NUDIX family)
VVDSPGMPRTEHQLTPATVKFCPLCGGPLAREVIPPELREEPVCSACRFIFYLGHKVVGGTIPWEEGRLLLTRRAIHPAYGKWTFPGGYVDWGESVEAGAIRETREETGLDVDLGTLVGIYSYADSPIVIVVYGARITGGSVRLCPENDRVQWLTPGEIPWDDLAFPSTRAALRDFLSGDSDGRRGQRDRGAPP